MNLSALQLGQSTPLELEEVRKAIVKKDPQAEKAAKGFEAMLAKSMMEELKNSMSKMGGTIGSDIFADMFTQSLSEQMADRGELGISKEIYAEVEKIKNKTQGVRTNP